MVKILVKILNGSNQVKPRFSKFTFTRTWLENCLVKAWLKLLIITKSWFYFVLLCQVWGEIFLLDCGNLLRGEWIWSFKPFLNLNIIFCKYWTLIKIKISLSCVCTEYKVKKLYSQASANKVSTTEKLLLSDG